MPVSRAYAGIRAHREKGDGRSCPPLTHLPSNDSWSLRQARLPPCTPSVGVTPDPSPSGSFCATNLSPLLGSDLQHLAPIHTGGHASPSGACRRQHWHLCRFPCVPAAIDYLLCCPGCSEALLLSQQFSLPVWESPWCENLSSFVAPSQGCRSHPNSFFYFFFFSFVLLSYVALPSLKCEVFC